jgi:hypothetical protein
VGMRVPEEIKFSTFPTVTRRGTPGGARARGRGPRILGQTAASPPSTITGACLPGLCWRRTMRKKRDKRQAQQPWYVRPLTFRLVSLIVRALIALI